MGETEINNKQTMYGKDYTDYLATQIYEEHYTQNASGLINFAIMKVMKEKTCRLIRGEVSDERDESDEEPEECDRCGHPDVLDCMSNGCHRVALWYEDTSEEE